MVHDVEAPELPGDVEWHHRTVEWWADVWASPMAPEYNNSDRHGLFLLAALVDQFWTAPTTALAAEIRLQRQCFGLTPMDRRRLQWEIERSEDAQEKGRKRRTVSASKSKPADDPRGFLADVPRLKAV
ncbi:hypothetical protein AB0I28_12555 [Phytomonospora sp. NPDC050363]|uniref:phage terminase small subunit n=1 Tax=Phytomonospora sp. NPDC050363 TaxID=3155642 RepID=UPI0033DB190F